MPFRTISVALVAEDASLSAGLGRASASIRRFETDTTRAGTNVTRSTGTMTSGFTNLEGVVGRGLTRSMTGFVAAAAGGYAAGRALNSALQNVVGGAVRFQAAMLNVQSISHLSADSFDRLSGQVLDLSRHLPTSAEDLASGLYDIASSGFQGAAGVEVLTASARAATAGLTDTATAARAITGVLNAYGEGADRAKFVSDSLFQTVNVGVLNFQDLAQGIGQVLNSAAAATVDIDQLGAAVATLTRAGQVPAEAFTNLNGLLAQIIKPSTALGNVFSQLGYESGAAAVKSKGLVGVMTDIQRATGGDITALSELFTDQRALRGATGLLTDQMRLYKQSLKDQEAAHRGAGTTADTLKVQLQAVSAQWDIFKNRVAATAISIGTTLLPVMNVAIHGLELLGSVIAHDGVRQTVELAAAVYGASLAFRALRAIAGTELVGTLLQLAGIHTANAAAITAEGAAATRTAAQLEGLAAAEGASAGAAGGRFAALGAVGRAGPAAAVLFAAALGVNALSKALHPGPDVDKLTNSLVELEQTGRIIGELPDTFGTGLKDLGEEIRRIVDPSNYQRTTDVAGSIVHIGGLLGSAHQDLDDAHKDFDALDKSLASLVAGGHSEAAAQVFHTLAAAANAQGVSTKDLTSLLPQYAQAQADVARETKLAAEGSNTQAAALDKTAAAAERARKRTAEFVSSAVSSARSAFLGSVDVVSQFKPDEAAQTVQDAQDQLLTAQRALREEQARYDAEKKHSISSDQQLAGARRAVTEATNGLADAQQEAAKSGDLETIYRDNIALGRQFADNARAAIERGLDPQLVARLLEQGPEQAGPLLEKLVADHSGHLIALANTSEHVLERISERAIRAARYTAKAIAPDAKDRLGGEISDALSLKDLIDRMPAPATGQWLVEKLGLTPKEIRRIADDFGIHLSTFIQQTLDKHPVHVDIEGRVLPISGKHHVGGFAEGGVIHGPGTSRSDSILARLSTGEFVVNADATRRNLALLNAINSGLDMQHAAPEFADRVSVLAAIIAA